MATNHLACRHKHNETMSIKIMVFGVGKSMNQKFGVSKSMVVEQFL